MSEFKFNPFQIKRHAHAVSRSDTSFNPFGHIWNSKDRRQTWDGEAQRHYINDDNVETGSPIEHSQSTSTGAHGADLTGLDRVRERPDSSGDTFLASQAPGSDLTIIDTGAQMRNRARLEKVPVDIPDSDPADEPSKKKAHRLFKNVQPKEPFTMGNQIQRVFLGSWLSLLLFCVPVGISLGAVIGP